MSGRANGAPEAAGEAAGTPPQDVGAAVAPAEENPVSLVGRRVAKLFGRKRYLGAVTAFCTEERWYTISYEDGCAPAHARRCCGCGEAMHRAWAQLTPLRRHRSDAEELDLAELTPLLLPELAAAPAAAADCAGGESSECVPAPARPRLPRFSRGR